MSGPVHTPHARRSRARRIAMIVWVVVFLLVAIPTIWSIISYATQPEDQRVPATGGDVTISEPGEYAVYAESTQGSPGNYGGIASLTAPSGAPVAVSTPGFNETYNYGSRVATRIATFIATESGTYRVVGADGGTVAGDELVISTRTVGSLIGVVGGAIATGVLLVIGLVGGLLMVLVGRRRAPPPMAYGPPVGAPAWPAPYAPYGGPPQQRGPYGSPNPYGPPVPQQPRPPEEPTVTVRPAEPPRPDDRS